MQRQHLTARAADPLAVVSDLCGLHAQVLSSAQLTLWARMEDPPDVNELLWRDRRLVKTWAQRGTLHLHRADELPLWVGAQAALKPRYETKAWLKHFKLSEQDVTAIIEGVPEALGDGPKTREELTSIHPGLARGYGDLLKPVAFRGELIYAEDGRFALPEPFERMDTEAATKEVARRFLTRYGPASREELAKWFGTRRPRRPANGSRGRGRRDGVRARAGGRRRGDRGGRASRATCGCCRRSTSTSSPRRATSGRRPIPSASTAPAGGSRRSCSSTA